MADIKVPIKIDGFKCIEDMVQAVLNYSYKGRTLKEWADSISEPQTNADRIRSMSDEELAEFLYNVNNANCSFVMGKSPCEFESTECPCWLSWLKAPAKEEA